MSLLPLHFGKMQKSAKERQRSQVFCLGVVVTIKVTENNLPMKILHEKDLIDILEYPHEI